MLAEKGGDLLVFDKAEGDEAVTELASVLTLVVQRLLELLRGDALLLEEKLSNADRHMNGTPDRSARGAPISSRIVHPDIRAGAHPGASAPKPVARDHHEA